MAANRICTPKREVHRQHGYCSWPSATAQILHADGMGCTEQGGIITTLCKRDSLTEMLLSGRHDANNHILYCDSAAAMSTGSLNP